MTNTTTQPHPTQTTAPAELPDKNHDRHAAPARNYVVEAIGTAFLVLTIGAVVRSGNVLAPLAIGSILMAMVYAGGHISGGHYNPAVTMAALVRRRIGPRDAIRYVIAQFVGALLGAVAIRTVIPAGQAAPIALSGHALMTAFVVEVLFTFALCFVVLNVATSKDNSDNSFYGLAIGFTVLAGGVAVGSISGGAFNPAVVFAGAMTGAFAGVTPWVYLIAQLAAGVIAGAAFRALNPDDK